MRIGHGFDVHKFGGEGPLVIGGVRIPYEQGLLAHSDGDVALHAATDALLGAAALGDIGKLFPDTDPSFKGADSRELLREAWRRIRAKGYRLGNLDVTIIAQGAEDGAAYPADARFPGGRSAVSYGRRQREGDHHGKTGVHRPWRRDCLRSGCLVNQGVNRWIWQI
ncbi:hypothetical protein GGER_08610 [Serratia rubidaea]